MQLLPKSKVQRFFLYGLAIAAGYGVAMVVSSRPVPTLATLVIGAGIVALAAMLSGVDTVKRFKQPTWVPEAAEGSVPRYGSRRWARACFHNGIISLEELNQFCATHKEDLRDPDR